METLQIYHMYFWVVFVVQMATKSFNRKYIWWAKLLDSERGLNLGSIKETALPCPLYHVIICGTATVALTCALSSSTLACAAPPSPPPALPAGLRDPYPEPAGRDDTAAWRGAETQPSSYCCQCRNTPVVLTIWLISGDDPSHSKQATAVFSSSRSWGKTPGPHFWKRLFSKLSKCFH